MNDLQVVIELVHKNDALEALNRVLLKKLEDSEAFIERQSVTIKEHVKLLGDKDKLLKDILENGLGNEDWSVSQMLREMSDSIACAIEDGTQSGDSFLSAQEIERKVEALREEIEEAYSKSITIMSESLTSQVSDIVEGTCEKMSKRMSLQIKNRTVQPVVSQG